MLCLLPSVHVCVPACPRVHAYSLCLFLSTTRATERALEAERVRWKAGRGSTAACIYLMARPPWPWLDLASPSETCWQASVRREASLCLTLRSTWWAMNRCEREHGRPQLLPPSDHEQVLFLILCPLFLSPFSITSSLLSCSCTSFLLLCPSLHGFQYQLLICSKIPTHIPQKILLAHKPTSSSWFPAFFITLH